MVCKSFSKKLAGSNTSGCAIEREIMLNQQSADDLHKQIIRKLHKRKVYSSFKDNIEGAGLVDMQLKSKYDKGLCFLLCAIDIFSKYIWVLSLKDKKRIRIINTFEKVLDQSSRKANKIWADKGSEFYNRSMKLWLEDTGIEIYSTLNDGKCVVSQEFISTKYNIYNILIKSRYI